MIRHGTVSRGSPTSLDHDPLADYQWQCRSTFQTKSRPRSLPMCGFEMARHWCLVRTVQSESTLDQAGPGAFARGYSDRRDAAFTGQEDKIVREEIIFMLTPSIVRDERLWEAGQGRPGDSRCGTRGDARSGLLPFSQTRMTANYNRDALEAYRNGELDLALFYANNSLRLDCDPARNASASVDVLPRRRRTRPGSDSLHRRILDARDGILSLPTRLILSRCRTLIRR